MTKEQIIELKTYLETEMFMDVFYSLPVRSPDESFISFEIISNREEGCFNKDLLVFTIV